MRIHTAVASALIALASAQAAPPPVLLEPLAGRQVFPATNWWNQDISAAPVDARSDQLIDWISGRTTPGSTAVRRLHPDFGPPPYGIPYVVVAGSQPRVPVTFGYDDESDTGAPGLPGYPIPDEARTTPNYIEGGAAGRRVVRRPASARHRPRPLAAVRDVRDALERRGRPLGCGLRRDLRSRRRNARRPEGWTSADAAGLAIFPGLVRYDEVAARRDHARVPRHDPRHQRLRLAGVASRRQHQRRAAARRAAAAESRQGHLRRSRRRCSASSAR